jgi:FkbM family methyltransferase
VSPGSLVFDVGANTGLYTETFLDLGASVVAFEPVPQTANKLRQFCGNRGKRLTIVQSAVGSEPGTLPLHISRLDEMCSLNENWLRMQSRNDKEWTEKDWIGTVEVPVVTLDQMISRYGMLEFIKIDVEGFEVEVLKGLSAQPKVLSFEFVAADIEPTFACLERFPDSLFNYVIGPQWGKGANKLALPKPVPMVEMKRLAGKLLRHSRTFGDILVFQE